MTLKALYNQIAEHYDAADQFGAITQSHQCAMQQIMLQAEFSHSANNSSIAEKLSSAQILDMGVGDGAFLAKLHQKFPLAHYTGIDVSAEMLRRAQANIPFTAIEASAINAREHLNKNSQDLVLAHFINAYIPIDSLLEQASYVTKKDGYFSFITTTYDAFPEAQKALSKFIQKNTLVSRIVAHYYQSITEKTTVAQNQELLLNAFPKHQFKIIKHQRLEIPIEIHNIDEFANFGIEGAWFLNVLSIKILPQFILLAYLKHLFKSVIQFPYKDKHLIDIILAERV